MEYKFRKNAKLGEWCSFLLLICFVPLTIKYDEELYLLLLMMSSWFCGLDFLTAGKNLSRLDNKRFTLPLYLLTAFPIVYIVWKLFTPYTCYFHALMLCYMAVCGYIYVKTSLLKYCPGSFTLGEAQLLSQSVILFLLSYEFSLFKWVDTLLLTSDFKALPHYLRFSQVLLLGSLLLICLFHSLPTLRNGQNLIISCVITAFLMAVTWSISLKQNFIIWLLNFCLKDKKRIYLILFWLCCTFISILFVMMINLTSKSKGTTIIRKFFHLIITAVYVPGILYDLELLRIASVIAFSVFLVLEIFRILKVPLIGTVIDDAFQVFLDEKDSGVLILTHIYLLIGCSCPIWLDGYISKNCHINLFSGIISVGIGDTTAAACGKCFGRHKWKGSNKTFIGSICALVMQIIFIFYFYHLVGHSVTYSNVLLLMLAVASTTYLEAKTDQVDNLVLPLCMFSILSWIQ